MNSITTTERAEAGWKSLEELQPVIEAGYGSLGYEELGDLGYRFLSSHESTLWSDRLIMSINPAGNRPDHANDGMFTAEGTSAYVDERWMAAPIGSSKLQRQYQTLFSYLGWSPQEVLQAPFSPYRHPSWAKIPTATRRVTIEFCKGRIWGAYFDRHCPAEIVSIGKQPAKAIVEIFPHRLERVTQTATGWNNRACDTATTYLFENGTTLVQIPHLSRFGIMTAPSCKPHLEEIFAALLDLE